MLGDKDALTEAILNVLENAVAYNLDDGSVSVQLHIRGKFAEITVRDTGIGIDKNELYQIFNKFYRSEAVKEKEGTGLGLSISKAVLLAHHGNIRAHNVESGGSYFVLTIPLAQNIAVSV
ncbi:MAG: ATP-binding protein [Candidatus Electrothrix sp. AR4]|nr:ATP-binding protein [Candidatus Electrothrix sp. AR4]